MFNRQYYNRGKYNTSAMLLAVSGAAALVLTGDIKGSLKFSAPPSAINIRLKANGKHVAVLSAPDTLASIRLNAGGQSARRLLPESPEVEFWLEMTGETKLVIFSPDSAADLVLDSTGEALRHYFAAAPEIDIDLGLTGQASRIMYSDAAPVEFNMYVQGDGWRRLMARAPFIIFNLDAGGSSEMFGYATISLPDLIIPPGGDLVIDTEDMTVMLNGEDVTRYFGADSEFFKLKPSDNVIIYEDGEENRDILYRILWKDLWL